MVLAGSRPRLWFVLSPKFVLPRFRVEFQQDVIFVIFSVVVCVAVSWMKTNSIPTQLGGNYIQR